MTEPHKNPSPTPLSTTPPPPSKKKRSLPGMPDPEAEIIALSPNTLLATNRFVCEICNKGFQREQNLQLHRRGHNMPWKLRQRPINEIIRKKVYVCPEPTCVHHNPSRALGDLTGVKKHFCRKHGEKKWKCERCSKNYAVKSDWKAHMKSCGSRDYKCDCGTLFSRRDSFVTHRAFCDVLANEGSNVNVVVVGSSASAAVSVATPPLTPSTTTTSVVVSTPTPTPTLSSIQSSDIFENPTRLSPPSSNASSSTSCCSTFSSLMSSLAQSDCPAPFSVTEPTTLSLFTPLYLSNNNNNEYPRHHYSPALSATALLQKAAQMGPSNSSLLRALGLKDNSVSISSTTTTEQWNDHVHVKQENELMVDNLGLGLPCGNGIMDSSGQPMTRDLLGLSMGLGRGDDDDLSALLTTFEGNFDSST